ncbi:MAG: hypothetical protein ACOC8F_06115 [Planctomycetota bacterium]
MDAIRRTLLEDPLYLYVGLALGELVLAAIWYERRTRRTAALLALPVLLTVAAFALERVVQTDRERIHAASRRVAHELASGDFRALRTHLSADFSGRFAPRDRALREARRAVDSYRINHVDVAEATVEVTDDRAEMTATVVVSGESGEMSRRYATTWRLSWAREDGVWRIVAADPTGRTGDALR